MSLILNIDTANEIASICLSLDDRVLSSAINTEQKDHAAWLHVAIEKLIREAGYEMRDLKAVAVTAGPGSYTGLRVGMATAKGLCYALNIPFITESTLKVMATAAKEALTQLTVSRASLLCPMIDARRMEVYTALYQHSLKEKLPPIAMVLEENCFQDDLMEYPIVFFGSGSHKWKGLCSHSNAIFAEIEYSSSHLASCAQTKFSQQDFTELAYSEPVYLKEFYIHPIN